MKLLLALLLLVGGYLFVMLHTTDIVLEQTNQLAGTYQKAANYSDQLAAGK